MKIYIIIPVISDVRDEIQLQKDRYLLKEEPASGNRKLSGYQEFFLQGRIQWTCFKL